MLPTLSAEHLTHQPYFPLKARIDPERPAHCCSNCTLNRVCLPRHVAARDMHLLDWMSPVNRRVRRDAALYRSRDAFAALYAVRSGSFKSMGISNGGVSKVTGFHLPGDLIGAEGIQDDHYCYSVVALEDSEVCRVGYDRLVSSMSTVPGLQTGLLQMISADISRDRGLMLLLGAMSAEQRVVTFLLSLSRRYAALHYAPDHFVLRMTRADIGSYLGLSLETVSRIFTKLAREGCLSVNQRDIVLKDAEGLKGRIDCW